MTERKRRDYSKTHANKFKETFDSPNGKNFKDERFWVLTRDESGNGGAVIRFLPNKKEDDLPFKQMFKHSMFINGKTFIDRCPTTIEKTCPVCDWNKTQDRDFVMKNGTYRKKSWICNILIISDPKNRENEGKVFLFEFGKQIHDILKEAVQPEDSTDTPLFYYCPDNGANFKIKVKKDGQYPTWSRSSFMPPSSIDEDLETLKLTDDDWLNALYDLDDVISENSYKEYDDLKVKFNKFLETIDMDGLAQENEVSKTENGAVESYSRQKNEANAKIEAKTTAQVEKPTKQPEPKTEVKTEVKTEKPVKSQGIEDKVAQNKKVKNYFNDIDDEEK